MKNERSIVIIGYIAVITIALDTLDPDDSAYNKNNPPSNAENPANIANVIPETFVCNLKPMMNKIIIPKIIAPMTS